MLKDQYSKWLLSILDESYYSCLRLWKTASIHELSLSPAHGEVEDGKDQFSFSEYCKQINHLRKIYKQLFLEWEGLGPQNAQKCHAVVGVIFKSMIEVCGW